MQQIARNRNGVYVCTECYNARRDITCIKKQGDRGGDCTKRHALKTQKIPQCATHLNAEGNANSKCTSETTIIKLCPGSALEQHRCSKYTFPAEFEP